MKLAPKPTRMRPPQMKIVMFGDSAMTSSPGGAQSRAEAEVGAPADDGAHESSGHHEGAGHERVHHVRQLNVGSRRAEHVDQLLVGEAERAIVARRSHLRQNQHDNGQHEELLNTPLGMRRFALRHYVLL